MDLLCNRTMLRGRFGTIVGNHNRVDGDIYDGLHGNHNIVVGHVGQVYGVGNWILGSAQKVHEPDNIVQRRQKVNGHYMWVTVSCPPAVPVFPPTVRENVATGSEVACGVCMLNRPSAYIEPCGHGSFCVDCLRRCRPRRCPSCFLPFTRVKSLYL